MAQHGRRHRAHHASRHGARARAKQQSFGRHLDSTGGTRPRRSRTCDAASAVSGTSGARGSPPAKPARSIAFLRPAHAVTRRDELGERRQPPLQIARLGMTAGAEVLVQLHRERGQDARHREDAARRADTERRVEGRRRSGDHRETVGPGGRFDEGRDLRGVAPGFLHADDVGMGRQPADGIRRQVDARHGRHSYRGAPAPDVASATAV